jgi:hypothetical protein
MHNNSPSCQDKVEEMLKVLHQVKCQHAYNARMLWRFQETFNSQSKMKMASM